MTPPPPIDDLTIKIAAGVLLAGVLVIGGMLAWRARGRGFQSEWELAESAEDPAPVDGDRVADHQGGAVDAASGIAASDVLTKRFE